MRSMSHWKATVNSKEYDISFDSGSFTLNGKPQAVEIAEIRKNEFSVLASSRSYHAEVVEFHRSEKRVVVQVNGNEYAVELKDKFDLLLQQMGMHKRAVHSAGSLQAPMPGKVLRVDVKQGQQVKKGESILILEAMKMENAIRAPGDGIVKRIHVKAGDAVEKGCVLVEME